MVTAAGRRARQPAAGAAAARRHVRRPRARPGPPAGRALRRPDDDGERRVPGGLPLLRPDHPARAAARHAAAGGPGAHRPRRRRAGRRSRLPQDVQAEECDFPVAMFDAPGAPGAAAAPRPCRARRGGRDPARGASGRCWSLGGGVRYSGAAAEALAFAEAHGVPVVETVAGRTLVPARPPAVRRRARHHRLHLGQHPGRRGRRGARGRHPAAGLHHLLVDGFAPDVRDRQGQRGPLRRRQARRARGRGRRPREPLVELARRAGRLAGRRRLGGAGGEREGRLGRAHRHGCAPGSPPTARSPTPRWSAWSTTPAARTTTCSPPPAACPGELHGGWRTGRSTRGAGATPRARRWTSSTASPAWATRSPGRGAPRSPGRGPTRTGVVTALLGDGSYLMLNSELYSAAFAGHPFVAVVCDNGGYAVIHRLQTGQGADGFNNLLTDARGPGARPGACASTSPRTPASLGLHGRGRAATAARSTTCGGVRRARAAAVADPPPGGRGLPHPPRTWTEAGAWWEVGVPASLSGRAAYDEHKADPAAVAGMSGGPPASASSVSAGWAACTRGLRARAATTTRDSAGRSAARRASPTTSRPALADAAARLRRRTDPRRLARPARRPRTRGGQRDRAERAAPRDRRRGRRGRQAPVDREAGRPHGGRRPRRAPTRPTARRRARSSASTTGTCRPSRTPASSIAPGAIGDVTTRAGPAPHRLRRSPGRRR